jgi:hypothetical protein
MEAYQRDRLGGFIINELQDAGCWDKSDAKGNNLEGAIHPLFEKRRWMNRLPDDRRLEIGKGVDGRWEMGNERVWEVMVPVLRLASRLISNVWLWPWFVLPSLEKGVLMRTLVGLMRCLMADGITSMKPPCQTSRTTQYSAS